jgi:uncharacterized protein
MHYAQHALAFLVVVVYPLWDLYDTREMKSGKNPSAKLRYYKTTMTLLWLFTAAALYASGTGIFFLGVDLPRFIQSHPTAYKVFAVALIAAILYAILGPHIKALRNPKVRAIILRQYARLDVFLPKRQEEFRWFAATCVTAGICEEIVYRGFLINYLARGPWHLGVFPAVLISSLSFGTAHLYQGKKGFFGTTIGGIIFALLFVLTTNLLLGILVHAALDLLIIPTLQRPVAEDVASA